MGQGERFDYDMHDYVAQKRAERLVCCKKDEGDHITACATQAMLCGRPHNISMEAMRQEGITDILTHDNHFTQEGFTELL